MVSISPNLVKVVGSRAPIAWNRVASRATLWCFTLLILSLFLFFLTPSFIHSPNSKSRSPTSLSYGNPGTLEEIPNYVHFVYILPAPDDDFTFHFKHFLSIYAAWHYWQPDLIYLHTNADANGGAITRAQAGQAGKWNQLIFTLFDNLRIITVDAPTHTSTGVMIKGLEHRSDFVRVKAVHALGGVYIDFDVHALRDLRILRTSGFKAIAGRQLGGQINSGVFMSVKGGRMVELWMHGMHTAYTGGWTTHSNEVITKFGQRLVREPGEMLIMERDAFAAGSWNNDDTDDLFAPHDDVPSNLLNDTDVGVLPTYEESFDDRWDRPQDFPKWARDWSSSYLLHAFTADRWGHKIEGFTQITPQYVLERRSNFARAVYPVARQMYEDGLIDVEDTFNGF